MTIEQVEERLGYHFGDRDILVQSMTHTSFGHEFLQEKPIALRNNERLEFLGDAVLNLAVTDLLLEAFPNSHEGQLSKMRAAVVNEKMLAKISENLNLSDCLRLGKGETQSQGAQKPSILASAFEALVAAIYLDGGFEAVYSVIRHLFSPFFQDEYDLMTAYDYKTQLQELMQARWKTTPTYLIKATTGPDHAKTFEIEVSARGTVLAAATGSSKKEAEQNAAKAAIHEVTG